MTFLFSDFFFISIIMLSSIVGIFRGLVREIFLLFIWIISFWCSFTYYEIFSKNIHFIDFLLIKDLIGYFLVFIFTFLFFRILYYFIDKLISKFKFLLIDKIFGFIFGFFRGFILIVFIILFFDLFILNQDIKVLLGNSNFVYFFEFFSDFLIQFLDKFCD